MKFLTILLISILALGIVSAGTLIVDDKINVETFTTKVLTISKQDICVEDAKILSKARESSCIKEKDGTYGDLDVSKTDLFTEDKSGVIRFKNE